MGSIEHLKLLLNNTTTHAEYAHLWNETSQTWAERYDVYAKFDDHVGRLTVGFGAPGGHLGTELEFGWYELDVMLNFYVLTDSSCKSKLLTYSMLLSTGCWVMV